MSAHRCYIVQPTYRGEYVVIDRLGFWQKCDDLVAAHALAKRLNEQHAKTQALAGGLIERHFGIIVDKGAA